MERSCKHAHSRCGDGRHRAFEPGGGPGQNLSGVSPGGGAGGAGHRAGTERTLPGPLPGWQPAMVLAGGAAVNTVNGNKQGGCPPPGAPSLLVSGENERILS